MDEIDFIVNAEATPDLQLSHKGKLYKTQLGRAYQCSQVQVDGLAAANTSVSNATALVHIQTFELQAFTFTDKNVFDACTLLHHS